MKIFEGLILYHINSLSHRGFLFIILIQLSHEKLVVVLPRPTTIFVLASPASVVGSQEA